MMVRRNVGFDPQFLEWYFSCQNTKEEASAIKQRNGQKRYCSRHRDEISARKKIYHEVHRDEINARRKIYREAHREETLVQDRENNRRYYMAHRDEISARRRMLRRQRKGGD